MIIIPIKFRWPVFISKEKSNIKFLLLLILSGTSCIHKSEPLTLFTLIETRKTGVDFSNNLTDTEEFNIVEYLNYYNGAGVAAGDINNDGLPDLYFASNQESNRLYLNLGNFRFRDITEKAGVACLGGWKTGVSMADVNGDGFLDIYVCQVGDYKTIQGKNHLYINNGDLTFSESAEAFGLNFKGFSTQSLFFDYDNDGDLDMFLLNHAIHTPGSYGSASIIRYTRDSKTGDRLFRQIERDGKPYFVNVTEIAGIYSSRIGYGLGVSAGDVNNDGFMDLYISNDFHENDYLYINNGDGSFTEKIRISMGHTTKSSMGNDMADFNNDGLLDIFSLDMLPEDETILKRSAGEETMEVFDMKTDLGYFYQLSRNALQLNQGKGIFSEIAAYAGVYATDWSWAPLFFDADNDGFKDLFISNGIPRRPNDLDYLQFLDDHAARIQSTGLDRISNLDLIAQMPSDTIANYAFKNNGDLTFTNNPRQWGLDQEAFSNACVYADLDNDGDLDLVVNNLNQYCFIYRNNAETLTSNNYLIIKLKGPEKNLSGFGARVEIRNNGSLQVQQLIPSRGGMSSVDPRIFFGLGNMQTIDSLIVIWPGGRTELREDVPANQVLELSIADARLKEIPQKSMSLHFSEVTNDLQIGFSHRGIRFNDFNYQPLVPHKLSSSGSGMAIGDVNGDGLEDLYICGGAGQSGGLLIALKNQKYEISTQNDFIVNAQGQETDAIFFDADGDGDLDLLISRGSTAHFNKPELQCDLLYLNNGKGMFTLDKNFPGSNVFSTCISVGDYNGDGLPDVFIGSRPDLFHYGYPGTCRLLKNNGKGRFMDVSNSTGKNIRSIGMVTSAVWADINNDLVPELIVTGEWMGIKIFEYHNDEFIELSSNSGLDKTGGWWNTITVFDLDNDGDLDLIAGNLGLNTKINGSIQHPAVLYAKDYDSNGTVDPIICFPKNGTLMPFPTLDDLIAQMPSIKTKFPTYSSYAMVRSIGDIFSDAQLVASHILEAHEFRTCIFENNGKGIFHPVPLPTEAQLYPVYSIVAEDLDKDGIPDLILGGNNYQSHITWGRYDAGYGTYLQGLGNLQFKARNLSETGLLLRGEVRDMAIIQNAQDKFLFVIKSNADLQVLKILSQN